MRGTRGKVFVAFSVLAAAVPVLSGCATSGGGSQVARSTAMDRAIGGCVASVAVGVTLGALVGGVAGGRNAAGRGALIGGAIGVGRCAILMEVAAAEDRARIREAELAAIRSNASQTRAITTRSGKRATVRTQVAPASVPTPRPAPGGATAPKPTYTNCRYAEQTVTVAGQSASAGRQLWCRADTGDWQAIEQ